MEEALLRDGPGAPTAAGISALPGEGVGRAATLGGEHPGLRRRQPRRPQAVSLGRG